MQLILVANHASGGGTDAGALARRLRAHGAEVVRSVDITDVAALEAGDAQRLVVAGGDGSIGLVAETAARAGVPLAVIAAGTANDFARALDLPLSVGEACALAADPAARTRAVELGAAGDRPFVNVASAGLSVLAAHRARPLKPRLGALAYSVGALRAGIAGRPVRVIVCADGRELFAGRAWQVIVGATGAFGGGSDIETADPHDGLLDVAVLEAGSRLALARRAYGLRFGAIVGQPGVHHVRAAEVAVDVPAGTRWNVDGELCSLAPSRFAVAGSFALVVGA